MIKIHFDWPVIAARMASGETIKAIAESLGTADRTLERRCLADQKCRLKELAAKYYDDVTRQDAIDWRGAELLLIQGCPEDKLADYYGLPLPELMRQYESFSGKAWGMFLKATQARRDAVIRRAQWDLLSGGKIAAARWLGIQYLGQSERQDISGTMQWEPVSRISIVIDESEVDSIQQEVDHGAKD